MRVLRKSIWPTIFVMVLAALAGRAQEQSAGQATPPAPRVLSPLASTMNNNNAEDRNAGLQDLAPDTRALAGARYLSLGTPAVTHSFWRPLFNLTSTLDTNPLATSRTSGLTPWTSFYGGLDLHRVSRRSELTLNYLGGGLISSNGSANNSLIQQLELGEKLSWRRSTISFFDLLGYLPETSFGFSLPSQPNLTGGQGLSVLPALTTHQSLLP